MTDWIPPQSVMSERDELFLQFLRLYKREKAYRDAVVLVLSTLAHTGFSQLSNQLLDQVRQAQVGCLQDADVRFRELESAVMQGLAYEKILQGLIENLK